MGQILHGSAKTTHAFRAAIQRSEASIKELAGRFSGPDLIDLIRRGRDESREAIVERIMIMAATV